MNLVAGGRTQERAGPHIVAPPDQRAEQTPGDAHQAVAVIEDDRLPEAAYRAGVDDLAGRDRPHHRAG